MKNSDKEFIFNNITALCDVLNKSCRILCEIIDSIDDRDSVAMRVSSYEDEGDNLFHDIRFHYGSHDLAEDDDASRLFEICTGVEAVIDSVDELARGICRYNVTSIKDSAITSIIDIERASTQLMQLLVSIRRDDNLRAAFKDVLALDHYKVEASKMYDVNMNKLFSTETNPIEVIKWQSVYALILSVFEAYEDVAEMCGKYIYRWN